MSKAMGDNDISMDISKRYYNTPLSDELLLYYISEGMDSKAIATRHNRTVQWINKKLRALESKGYIEIDAEKTREYRKLFGGKKKIWRLTPRGRGRLNLYINSILNNAMKCEGGISMPCSGVSSHSNDVMFYSIDTQKRAMIPRDGTENDSTRVDDGEHIYDNIYDNDIHSIYNDNIYNDIEYYYDSVLIGVHNLSYRMSIIDRGDDILTNYKDYFNNKYDWFSKDIYIEESNNYIIIKIRLRGNDVYEMMYKGFKIAVYIREVFVNHGWILTIPEEFGKPKFEIINNQFAKDIYSKEIISSDEFMIDGTPVDGTLHLYRPETVRNFILFPDLIEYLLKKMESIERHFRAIMSKSHDCEENTMKKGEEKIERR